MPYFEKCTGMSRSIPGSVQSCYSLIVQSERKRHHSQSSSYLLERNFPQDQCQNEAGRWCSTTTVTAFRTYEEDTHCDTMFCVQFQAMLSCFINSNQVTDLFCQHRDISSSTVPVTFPLMLVTPGDHSSGSHSFLNIHLISQKVGSLLRLLVPIFT